MNIIKRLGLKTLAWLLQDVDATAGHPLNTSIYRRSFAGRTFDKFVHPQVTVGDYTYGLRRESFFAYHPDDRVVIGKFCSIADGVRFVFGGHRLDTVSTFPFRAVCFDGQPHADTVSKGDITVGNDVWIGVNALILAGVKIGDGAVIAAGAVVTQDVAPYAVVGGVPAKVVKMRLGSEAIAALQKIQWWNWPIEKIRENLDLFYSTPDAFIRRHLPKTASTTPEPEPSAPR